MIITWTNLRIYFARPQTVSAVQVCDGGVDEGQLVLISGDSGVGKSTFLKTLCGLVPQANRRSRFLPFRFSNEVEYAGDIVSSISRQLPVVTCYMPQDPPFFDGLSILDNIHLFGDKHGAVEHLRADLFAILQQLGVSHPLDTSIELLSGGERKRVALARCLLSRDAKIVCLDEPFAGLDYGNRKRVVDFLYRACVEQKRALIVASHEIDDLFPFASSIFVFSKRGSRVETNAWQLSSMKSLSDVPQELLGSLPFQEGISVVESEKGGSERQRHIKAEELEIVDGEAEDARAVIVAWGLGPRLGDGRLVSMFVPTQRILINDKTTMIRSCSVTLPTLLPIIRGERVKLRQKQGAR